MSFILGLSQDLILGDTIPQDKDGDLVKMWDIPIPGDILMLCLGKVNRKMI